MSGLFCSFTLYPWWWFSVDPLMFLVISTLILFVILQHQLILLITYTIWFYFTLVISTVVFLYATFLLISTVVSPYFYSSLIISLRLVESCRNLSLCGVLSLFIFSRSHWTVSFYFDKRLLLFQHLSLLIPHRISFYFYSCLHLFPKHSSLFSHLFYFQCCLYFHVCLCFPECVFDCLMFTVCISE